MNGKFASAGIVFAMVVGIAGPVQAQAVFGAVGGVTGGVAQGNFGGALHGRLDGAARGTKEAGVPQQPDPRGMIRRGGDQAQDTAGNADSLTREQAGAVAQTTHDMAAQTGDAAAATSSRTSNTARTRAGTTRERSSMVADRSASKATGVAGAVSARADDSRPDLDQPQRPGRPDQQALPQLPAEAGLGLATAVQGDADADRSGARVSVGGISSAEASSSAWEGTEASAGASGAAQAEVAADAPR